MAGSSNHSIRIVVYHRLKNDIISIGMRGRFGRELLGQFSTGIRIEKKDWDKEIRFIKADAKDKYKNDYKKLKIMQDRMEQARDMLAEGLMHWKSVESFIKNAPMDTEDQSLLDYVNSLEQTKKRQYTTLKKHRQNISALQNKVIDQQFNPLMFSHLRDMEIVRGIQKAVLNSGSKSSYKRQQLLSVQLMWREKNQYGQDKILFDDIPPETSNPTPKDAVDDNQFMDSIVAMFENPNTSLLQFEAILFWLYSASMCGIDGMDLINLDEDNLVQMKGIKKLDYYHPDVDFAFGLKRHINLIRSKSRFKEGNDYVVITRMINLFPTLYLLKLLKHTIKINHPKLAYKGDDEIKLFNFRTRDKETRMQIPDGMDKWKELQYSYYGIYKERLGTSLQALRTTLAQVGQKMDLTEVTIDTMLGHSNRQNKSVSKALKNYLPEYQLKNDTEHIFMLDGFDIVNKIDTLVDMFKERTTIVNNKRVRFIPDEFLPMEGEAGMTITEAMDKEHVLKTVTEPRWDNNLLARKLSNWSKAEEMEFQKFVIKYNKPVKRWDKTQRKSVTEFVDEKDYDQRFKDLLIKRYKPFNDTVEEAFKRYNDEREALSRVYDLVND